MTDQELDRMLRRALLDAADQEAQTPPETEVPLSEGHRRRMREMLRDPLLWFRLRNPYPWRTVARRAAVVLLMLSLSAAMVLAVSPKARADIIRWTMQQDGRRVEFRYHGDGPAQALPQYRIAALPEGYTETERAASYAAGDVKYTNADGDMILLSYLYMSDGVVSGFELDNGDTMTDTQVNGIPATLIVSSMEGNFSSVTWRDTASNIEFTVAAVADESVIIAMAESVSLCNSTALMMSLSLMVPAFAAGTCNHSFKRVIVGTYVWYDNITSMGHQWNKGDLLQCSKCGAKVGVAANSTLSSGHHERSEYSSDHSSSNPAKHMYVKIYRCKECLYITDRKSGFTGCTASGCREYQSIKPVPVTE